MVQSIRMWTNVGNTVIDTGQGSSATLRNLLDIYVEVRAKWKLQIQSDTLYLYINTTIGFCDIPTPVTFTFLCFLNSFIGMNPQIFLLF